jgi:uncharacterized membrane protein YkvA (DUF1232 family)
MSNQRSANGEHEPEAERHPAARLAETLSRLPSYLRLTRALLGDRRLGRLRKAGLGGGLAYLASPIDLVPGIVPVLGQVDDLLVILLAIRYALRGLPEPAADALLARVGLSRSIVARDIANTRAAGGWAARSAARIGGRVAVTGAHAAATGIRAATRVASKGVGLARSGIGRLGRGPRGPSTS